MKQRKGRLVRKRNTNAFQIRLILCVFLLFGFVGYVSADANFTASTTFGSAPLTVQFNDTSTNTPTGWAWFFGDETYTAPWTQVNASAGWSARDAHSSVAMPDGSIVLIGGHNALGDFHDVWRSKDNGATWTQVNASAGWSGRSAHSSVAMPDGSIVLIGGTDGYSLFNDVWRSTDNGTTGTQVNASAGWSARYLHTSVALADGSIVLMGGDDDSGYKNDVWRSTDNGTTWTQVNASAGWSTRGDHSSVVLADGSIVLMGGFRGGDYYKNDVWRSMDNGTTWTQVNASAGWSARYLHSSVAMPDGSIVLMGGVDGAGQYDSSYKNDVWRSTDNGTTWTQVNASAGWSGRSARNSVAMPDGSIVLMGGYNYCRGYYKNDVWRFMPAGSSARNPSHTYTTPGIYPVALQAYNTGGYNSTRKTGYIIVTPPAPVTNFTGTPRSGTAPLNVQFNDTSTGPGITAYKWVFSDSATVYTTRNITHTFADPGTYHVSHSATNSSGTTWKNETGYITVTAPPVAKFETNTTSGTPPLTVRFTDTSAGGPTRWNWSFGDRQWFNTTDPAKRNPVHTYVNPGGFIAKLIVSGTGGSNTTEPGIKIIVSRISLPGPVASFTTNRTSGNAPLAVQFYDISSNYPTAWNWSFGDGTWFNTTTASAKNPKYIYANPGSFIVRLTVSNAAGRSTTIPGTTITVTRPGTPAPVASFTANRTSGYAPLAVQFYDTSSNYPTVWNWSFGDGIWFNTTVASVKNPKHIYANPGSFIVRLMVSNAAGKNTTLPGTIITVR